MDNALDRGPDESQSSSLFTDAEEAKLSPDVPPISIPQAGYGLSTTQDEEKFATNTFYSRSVRQLPVQQLPTLLALQNNLHASMFW